MLVAMAPDVHMALGYAARTRLSGFVRLLRDNAFAIGLAETRDALQIMAQGHAARPSLLGAALKTLFCSRHSDWAKFDELFDAYWLQRGMKSATRIQGAPQKPPAGIQALANGQRGDGREENPDRVERGEGSDDSETGQSKREGASRTELLSQTDFRHLIQGEDIAAAHALAERLSKSMRARLTRRMRARRTGQRIDLRRTIHKSIAHGGIPLDLVRRKRKDKPLKLVMLLDASGSMSLYSSVFLRFMYGVLENFREAEAFVFHTRLIHISPALRERNAQRAMERMSILAQGTGGGTRIGDSLATFNRWHAKRCITSRTCVMIVSDGYDTGPAEELGQQMQALRRRCKRIAWLNPMIGWQDYAPEAAGMKAALPHVDLFAPAHNLQSLEALEPYLARI